jgi:hypothetical protein
LRAILSLYSGSSTGCEDQPCSWVRREGREREKERIYVAKCGDRTICFHLIDQETHFCGSSPRERVNHVYLIVFVVDVVLFSIYCIVTA